MPYVRVTRDERGYETTFLLHVRGPGDRPHVLYWYRTAPGVRVGRPALDEEAIRAIEEQYPDIAFDWEHLIEATTMLPPEVERRPERPRRKPPRPAEADPVSARPIESARDTPANVDDVPRDDAGARDSVDPEDPSGRARQPEPPPARRTLLDELVGREIAARLRARHAELVARLNEVRESARRADWQPRADALNPDSWATAEAILDGVQQADRRFDELRREIG